MKSRHCELCNADATVFCSSDAAFLCWSCDAKVHDANFLVARHVRLSVCSSCRNFTGQEIAGAGSQPPRAICSSCSDEDEEGVISSGYSSFSSDCISSTTSPVKEYPDLD
ncbi:B-box zinc finger protein 32 [Phtheirospermum japonicum]|uniref:B-box zinc finger protein 32 n=1 Tax=Phtheirospermum japonicum TaxID=374723 RepID=A0A830CTH2_9LAMI|nr:B-box zinc finger protein 32 [Phtheirospermum japonicum]